jgi:uncharacterized protein (UPF0332 family)
MATPEEVIQQYMQQAAEMLAVAESNFQLGYYGTSMNRSYYAVFHAATALLFSLGETRGKHHGLIAAFQEYFVKQGLWPVEFSDIYRRLLKHREQSDYAISFTSTQENARQDLKDARRFVATAKSWLQKDNLL